MSPSASTTATVPLIQLDQAHVIRGQVRVLQHVGENAELIHLAQNREAAELWLAKAGYSRARLEEVTADEIGADDVEGRAAA